MDGVTAVIAGLLTALHRSVAPDVCPGGWPWAVSLLGVFVGLLPAVGALLVAMLRKAVGNSASVVCAAIGVVFAGLAPLLVFTATGRVFTAAAAGNAVPGLARTGLRSEACFAVLGSQADYLGRGTVGQSFMGTSPLRLGVGLVGLGLVPVIVATLTFVQARIALRRGPRWPAAFFWLSTLGVALLTMAVPAFTAAHLWLGAGLGALLGMLAPLAVGPPPWAVVGGKAGKAGKPPPARSATSPSEHRPVRPPRPGSPRRPLRSRRHLGSIGPRWSPRRLPPRRLLPRCAGPGSDRSAGWGRAGSVACGSPTTTSSGTSSRSRPRTPRTRRPRSASNGKPGPWPPCGTRTACGSTTWCPPAATPACPNSTAWSSSWATSRACRSATWCATAACSTTSPPPGSGSTWRARWTTRTRAG